MGTIDNCALPRLPGVWVHFQLFHDHHDAFHFIAKALRISQNVAALLGVHPRDTISSHDSVSRYFLDHNSLATHTGDFPGAAMPLARKDLGWSRMLLGHRRREWLCE
jgi:hypothetical protein